MSYETGNKYRAKADKLTYPQTPPRPSRDAYPSHAAFGAAMDEWEALRAKCKEARVDYSNAESAITEEFKAALGREYGVLKHPKFERCWSIAWEYGHGSGYPEVGGHFGTLAELLQP